MNSTLTAAAASMQGKLHGADCAFAGVSTDSRTIGRGELFFALAGPNYDGGKFVADASEKGAAGAVVAAPIDNDLAQIAVDDTRLALGRLGAAWRDDQPAVVVGVTGSNGKTTLKELIAACLSQVAPTIATAGNLNNDIGMPLMLLRIDTEHEFAVLEMGANHIGEIAYLTSLAKPDVVVITNAGTSHLEGFGSIDGIAQGKGEILCGEPRPRCAVLNAEDEYYDYWRSLVSDIDVLSFGLLESADISASSIKAGKGDTSFTLRLHDAEIDVQLPLVGMHNVRNACAAAAVAVALGVKAQQIKAALESVTPVAGRLQPAEGLHGATLFDDSYNANPVSVTAAGKFMASLDGENWMLLGDMGELGADTKALHRQVGKELHDLGIDRLFAVGELSQETVEAFGAGGVWFDSVDKLVAHVAGELKADVNVLVKGSRAARMERVVAALHASQALRREA
ncbi:MAG: UDP-N-acetylmuramoyl-tripeptide--D-alanyl-D-alanine ligase [Woeseiaceae bacterium]